MGYFFIILLAAVLIYIFYLYQAMYSQNTCYAALFLSLCQRFGTRGCSSDRLTKYREMRAELLLREKKSHIGGNIQLSDVERVVNQKILKEKEIEYDAGYEDPKMFNPSHHFFSVMDNISSTPLFKMIRTMPKGGILHAHDMALGSPSIVMEMTYRENLWVLMSGAARELNFVSFRFSRSSPTDDDNTWILLKQLRNDVGDSKVDEALMKRFVMYPHEKYADQNDVWEHFMGIFILIDGLLTFEPVWREYFYKALQELYDDGVQYLEIRSILPILYDLNETEYTAIDTARIWYEESVKFQNEHDDFIGVKLIYAPLRSVSDFIMQDCIRIVLELKEKLPDFLAGFDMVNHEDGARTLKEFAELLLGVQNDINFFFHAGETNWFGSASDENLIDAILLGTKRIGHGFAVVKHPEVLRIIKQHDIAIEVNPISNQVLLLVSDFRNHPCAHLFAENYPVVISSDDCGFWKATPLSHDFYIAFLGIASRSAGLGMLKQLAWNSLKYSSLDDQKKDEAFEKFIIKWNKWLDVIKEMPPIQRRELKRPSQTKQPATKWPDQEAAKEEVKETQPDQRRDSKRLSQGAAKEDEKEIQPIIRRDSKRLSQEAAKQEVKEIQPDQKRDSKRLSQEAAKQDEKEIQPDQRRDSKRLSQNGGPKQATDQTQEQEQVAPQAEVQEIVQEQVTEAVQEQVEEPVQEPAQEPTEEET